MSETELIIEFEEVLYRISDEQLRKEASEAASAVIGLEVIADESESNIDPSNLYALVREMSVSQKVKAALLGNKTVRGLLIRDNNKQIPIMVLENPRITENEVLEFAKNTNLDDSIHKAIAANSSWMKSYALKLAVVSNPKVPLPISLRYLKFIRDNDLRRLSKSKNIPQVIAGQCRKLLEKRHKKPGGD